MRKIDKDINLVKKFRADDNNLYIAVNFDGVIHDIDYEKYIDYKHFDQPMKGAALYLNKLHDEGWKIIVNTCRKQSRELVSFLLTNDIPCDAINKNLTDFSNMSDKPYADVYLDDKDLGSIGKPWDWQRVYRSIKTKFKKYYKNGKVTRNG
jgi:hypothetical protein